MPKKKELSLFIINFLIFIALIIFLLEGLLTLYGKSLCANKACEISQFLILIPKTYLLSLAGLYFFSLFLITWLYNSTEGSFFLNLLLFLISAGLMAEGVFIGRLLLDFQLLCYFCLFVAGVLFLISLFYLLFLRRISFNSYTLLSIFIGGLAGIFFAFKVTSQSQNFFNNPEKKYFLIYSQDCSRCTELLSKVKRTDLEEIPLQRAYLLLKFFKISTVPVLIEREEKTWRIYPDLEDMEKKLLNNTSSIDKKCGNETQGGVCALP